MDKNIFKVKGTYVNGQWFNSKNTYEVFNPSNSEKLSDVPISDKKELELAVESAKKAQAIWSKTSLIERVKKDKIDEVILATSATVEGQTTAFYIQDSLKDTNAKITKLAQGLPVGGEIESLDDGTLLSAFKNRSKINSNSS